MSSTQEAGDIFGEGTGSANAMLRSPTVLIASVGLWGMNVFLFKLFQIDYVHVLQYDLMKEREAIQLNSSSSNGPPSKNSGAGGTGSSSVNALEDGSTSAANTEERITGKSSDLGEDDTSYQDAVMDGDGGSSNVTWGKLVVLSFSLLFLLHFTIYVWIGVCKGRSIGAVFCFYGAVAMGILFPLSSTQWLRTACVVVLQRTFELLNPRCSCVTQDPKGPRPIPFIDVFFADAMCSLSKVFFDWGMLFHLASHYPNPVPKSAHSILIPSFCAAIPYIIRARQCMIMYTVGRIKRDPRRYQHILNAIKYTTSIFPLCLSAYQQTIEPARAHKLEGFLIALLVINALYALAWDIIMDWGMMQNPGAVIDHTCVGGGGAAMSVEDMKPPTCGHAVLRPRLRFGLLMSTAILIADAFLRFSWVLRFHERLLPSKDHFVLATQFLEVFRRAIWNLLRVEWEHIKQANSVKSKGSGETESFIKAPVSISLAPLHQHGHKP